MLDNDRRIVAVATAIDLGADVEEMRANLLDWGFNEYDAWLTFKAGELLSKSRENDPDSTIYDYEPL